MLAYKAISAWDGQLPTGYGPILPLLFCPKISRILPIRNFISALKYMTQAWDCP
jgi:hypothetical protein